MLKKVKILAISGSTRKASSNLNLIKAIANLNATVFTTIIFDELARLPHFNPDLDNENAPEQIKDFRRLLKDADGVLICSPEYAMGVPGALKNAIDWTVSSMDFSKKPTALITASLSGGMAHQSLLRTLLLLEAKIMKETQLLISFVNTKVNNNYEIIDDNTLTSIKMLTQSLIKIIMNEKVDLLAEPVLMNNDTNYSEN